MRFWIIAFFCFFASLDVHAADNAKKKIVPKEEVGFFEVLDNNFGKWFVGPLASVLFFDLMFWDNTIEKKNAVGMILDPKKNEDGEVIDGTEVMKWTKKKGYKLVRRFKVPVADVKGTLNKAVENKNDVFSYWWRYIRSN